MYEKNVLNQLVNEKIRTATENRDDYTSKFRTAIQYLENHALKQIATDVENEYPINKKLGMKIEYSKEVDLKDYINDIGVMIEENNQAHPLCECGSGVQSLTIISLYNLLGKLKNENIVVGLEEPETNLHPQAQKELIEYFQQLIKGENILQFFFTTHSSIIVDQVDHTEIILFKKTKDDTRGFKSIVTRLSEDYFDKHHLQDFKYYQYFRYSNSSFFFAKHIVITESKNEIEIINPLGQNENIQYDTCGLSYLHLDGVDKAKYAIYLLKGLEIPFTLIVDKDFFFGYVNDDYKNSLANGFPQYKPSFKNEQLIKTLIPRQELRTELLTLANGNHTRIMDILEPYNIVSMRYSLDLDLVAIDSARTKYFELLSIPEEEQNIERLTKQAKNAIKKIRTLIDVFK